MFGVAGDAANLDSFLTTDEESSGIFDASNLFGGSGSTFMFNAQVHPVSAAAGVSFATDGSNDGLIARATAILRPDLLENPHDISIASGLVEDISSKRYLTLTLDGVTANADNDGFVSFDGTTAGTETLLSDNDAITLRGIDAKYVGTYSVSIVDLATKKIRVGVKLDAAYPVGALTDGVGRVMVSDDAASRTFKTNVIEGGGLYTLKSADLEALFTTP
jgi:hypothetical protein